jgi:hypothetical protein
MRERNRFEGKHRDDAGAAGADPVGYPPGR